MSQVEFEEDSDLALRRSLEAEPEAGGIVGMLLKTGIVKNESQANAVMVVMIIICIGLIVFFMTR